MPFFNRDHEFWDLYLKSLRDESCGSRDNGQDDHDSHEVLLHHEKEGDSWACRVHGLCLAANMVGLDSSAGRLKTALAVVFALFFIHIMHQLHKSVRPSVLFSSLKIDLLFPRLWEARGVLALGLHRGWHFMLRGVWELVLLVNLHRHIVRVSHVVLGVFSLLEGRVIVLARYALFHLRHGDVSHKFRGDRPGFLH